MGVEREEAKVAAARAVAMAAEAMAVEIGVAAMVWRWG